MFNALRNLSLDNNDIFVYPMLTAESFAFNHFNCAIYFILYQMTSHPKLNLPAFLNAQHSLKYFIFNQIYLSSIQNVWNQTHSHQVCLFTNVFSYLPPFLINFFFIPFLKFLYLQFVSI